MKFGTYSDQYVINYKDFYIFTTKFTVKGDPEIYRYVITKHRNQDCLYCLWQDKNKRARKFENKYFLNFKECLDSAKNKIDEMQNA